MTEFETPPRRHSMRYEPSERLSDRKRALFPTNKENVHDSDDDLGHMSPLELSSSPDRYESPFASPEITKLTQHQPFSNKKKFSNLFENVVPLNNSQSERTEVASPVILAPSTPSPLDSPVVTSLEIPETPTKGSPTQALKTPHETSSNNQLPRLIRKSLSDLTNIDKTTLKRKQESPQTESSAGKSVKLETTQSKISKARTTLFPENAMPTKSFYPKSADAYKPSKTVFSEPLYRMKKPMKRQSKMYLCSRKKVNKSWCGQINAGVRHGIKKPKNKTNQLSKSQILNVALDIIDNSPLNAYLDDLNKENVTKDGENTAENVPSCEQINVMDSILKNMSTEAFKAQPLTSLTQPIVLQAEKNKTETNKRPLSPQPDTNKKFFKSSRTHATITINKNIKLTVDNGEMHLVEKKQKKKRLNFTELNFDASDLIIEEDKLSPDNFNDILKSLDNDNAFETTTNANNITLTAHNSVTASDSSIQLHSEPLKAHSSSILLSPTTLMCDLTSGLALNSPKNQTVQVQAHEQTFKKCISFPDETYDDMNDKLYPIFYKNNNNNNNASVGGKEKESQKVCNLKKIWKPMSDDQMVIDAGQKKWGHTQCPECKLVYQYSDPDDERMHYNYHNSISVLRFNGWKNERIVSRFEDGRVILVQPEDPKIWWKKVKELTTIINRDLGFVDVDLDNNHCKVYMYIRNKQIEGCIITEPKTRAHKMLPFAGIDQCTEESFPVKCGISRLWIPEHNRRKGVATMLMNAMRCNYMYGHILDVSEIAFSAPTEAGKSFATKYTGTEEFLIYTS